MFCPICECRLMPVGSTMVESFVTPDGAVTSVQNTYQCRNAECESFAEGYIWTCTGERFILHCVERDLEAA